MFVSTGTTKVLEEIARVVTMTVTRTCTVDAIDSDDDNMDAVLINRTHAVTMRRHLRHRCYTSDVER